MEICRTPVWLLTILTDTLTKASLGFAALSSDIEYRKCTGVSRQSPEPSASVLQRIIRTPVNLQHILRYESFRNSCNCVAGSSVRIVDPVIRSRSVFMPLPVGS